MSAGETYSDSTHAHPQREGHHQEQSDPSPAAVLRAEGVGVSAGLGQGGSESQRVQWVGLKGGGHE